MKPILEVRGVEKRFSGVHALKGVDLQLREGEVLALLGENGAGKSTLMKILAGVQRADGGEIRVDGEPVDFHSVGEALEKGIALIHQELNLAENLDVAANVFLGREPLRWGLLDTGRMHREAGVWLEKAGLDVEPSTAVGELTIGRRQQVEIAKALAVDARILIMDEPTSSLSESETQVLFGVIRELKRRGVAVIYISHRLGEVQEVADRVTVLRDGEWVGDLEKEEITHEAMVKKMVGRDLDAFFPRRQGEVGEEVLRVEGLRTLAHPAESLSFSVRAGEIVGVAGLVGAGRSEALQAVFGVDRRVAGQVEVSGTQVKPDDPRAAIAAGLALVPEDRKRDGLVLEMGVPENLSLVSLSRDATPGGFRRGSAERRIEAEMGEAMKIKTAGAGQAVGRMSGGNQQKVVIGKWLAMEPEVLLLDEPTRGVDVGAKHEIYLLMESLAERGKAVLFVSSDLVEVLAMSDRVLVMHEGQLAGELCRGEATEESVMAMATGGEIKQ